MPRRDHALTRLEAQRGRAVAAADTQRSSPGRGVRLDIEGMRALAIGTVLAFHAGLPWFSGGFVGVDVFFVLSGFLITSLLVREIATTGRVRLANFWARRARRLLPASAVVLAFSTFVAWLWLPVTQRSTFGGDILSAALYVVNWRLADRSVDYLAEDVGASPVQHFWSLAVEEQFYVVWPLLMLAVAVLFARRPVRGAFLALSTITLVSFVYSVQQSTASPDTAFFVSSTRVWELGAGALLALGAPYGSRVPAALRAAAGWAGIAAILYATVAFDGATTWPGTAALVPVLGSVGMILSGIVPTPRSPGRVLGLAPLVWVGGLSYSLYLWHWPMLVAGEALIEDFRIRHGVLLTLLAVVPAWLSHRWVENPVRFGRRFRAPRAALRLGAALTAAGVLLGGAMMAASLVGGTVQEATPSQAQGARALVGSGADAGQWADLREARRLSPLPEDATQDRPPFYDEQPECQVSPESPDPEVCEFGDTGADRTVVIVGDSKMVQWQPTLSAIAEDEGWRLVQISKSACTFTDAMITINEGPYTACREWGRAAQQEILAMRPDLVITSGGRSNALSTDDADPTSGSSEAMVQGLVRTWSTLEAAGIPVAVLVDNPRPSTTPVYECVAQNPDDVRACSFDRAEGLKQSGAPSQLAAVERMPDVGVIDMNDVICAGGDRCPAVIGNVLVYRQGTHITTTFADSARLQLAAALAGVSEGRFGTG